MADPRIHKVVGPTWTAKIGYASALAGDLVTFTAATDDWDKADADAEATWAQAIVVQSGGADGDDCVLCKECVLIDSDSVNHGDVLYLSTTAGAYTATRPTGVDDLMQVVGWALDSEETVDAAAPADGTTDYIHLKVNSEHEETHYVPFIKIKTGTSATDSDADFVGIGLLAANDDCAVTLMIPQNAVSIVKAYLWWCGTGVALDASDTYTIDVSGGVDDETTSANADGIAAAALTVAANDLNMADVSAAFDAVGFEPGGILGILVAKAAEGSAGDDPIMLGVGVVFRCV